MLFGPEAFEQHGRELARVHAAKATRAAWGPNFFPRLHDNLRSLRQARASLGASVQRGRHVGPAATWLLDNASLIEEQVHAIRRSLPRAFFRRLPCLIEPPLQGLPRVYGLAWAYVAHADSRVDADLLEPCLRGYLGERSLLLAELWALPATLRVVLVENLRRLAARAAAEQSAREAAHAWFDAPLSLRSLDQLEAARAHWARRGADASFLLQIERRMERAGDAQSSLFAWMAPCREWLAGEEVRLQAHAAEDQQSLRNAILGLRQIDRVAWRDLWQRVHPVVRELQALPLVPLESEATQDRHLEAIASLARDAGRPETAVVRALCRHCEGAVGPDAARRQAPGYWLQGPGEKLLRGELGLPPRRLPRPGSAAMRPWATAGYGLALGLGTVLGTLAGLDNPATRSLPWAVQALTGLLLVFPVSEAAVALLNRLISESTPPTRLPRLSLAAGLGPEHRTLVVIPCMLGDAEGIASLAEQLEQHHLANPEKHTQYALLSDPPDADALDTPADASRLQAAVSALSELNARYPVAEGQPLRFLLLHRPRRWSASEQAYIGWERKRGKLEALLGALAGTHPQDASPFIDLEALSRWAPGVRHLVTLDSDTDMPPGRLRELVAVAAHPLNQPQVDPVRRRVVQGWGILQPRIVTPLPVQEADTWFHRLFSGGRGIDPYSAASSEVYQDLFGEGSYTGKGLIHVEAAVQVLGGRLPQDQVLSHDLLEGALMRCAGVSDITLVEDAPLHSDVAASRLHRWTRGDWQLLPLAALLARARLPVISLWKMLDNLRRSLVTPASALLLVLSTLLGVMPWVTALAAVLLAYGAGPLLGAVAGLAPRHDGIALRPFFRAAALDGIKALLVPLWHLLTLLDQAWMYADAVVRASWRQWVSRRGLLEWLPAASAQAAVTVSLPGLMRRHAAPVALAGAGLGLLAGAVWRGLMPAAPVALGVLLLVWAATPLWVREASRPRPRPRRERLRAEDAAYLHHLSRDTWRFYAQYVGPQDHHLPPDNIQLVPHLIVAHRTSPTNIGLYLLAVACAQRLGFIGRVELAERLHATLTTLESLPRESGHLYNWYDTRSLAVLAPAYVSTVDSGNLCALLRVLAQACEAAAQPGSAQAAQMASDQALKAARERIAPLLSLVSEAAGLQGLARLLQRPQTWPAQPGDARALREEIEHSLAAFAAMRLQPSADDEGALQTLADPMETLLSALRDLDAEEGPLCARLQALAARARALAEAPDFGRLYDPARRMLHIGLRADTGERDANHYDLLASESRLASLVAIAKADVPPEHWAALGRPCWARGAQVGLMSWSGSMFEYLMPSLVLDEPPDSLLGRATRLAVREQQAEAEDQGTPWGISESGIAAQDASLAYQYGPQGVRKLALRRTPVDERVLAPYACAMASMLAPAEAIENLRRFERLGLRRAHGFVEAIDYTPSRQLDGRHSTVVQSHMAHHQAMSLIAWTDLLTQGAPRRWAACDPHLRAVRSLLHETAPREVPLALPQAPRPEVESGRVVRPLQVQDPAATSLPLTALLGHGGQAVWIDARGVGMSRWNGIALTRWRDDPLRATSGLFAYLEDDAGGARVSLSARPAPDPAARYTSRFLPDRVVLEARSPRWHSSTTLWVAPEDEAEVREIEIASRGDAALDATLSLATEITLAPPQADASHPAFSNLFVAAQWDARDRALYFMRRPRLPDEAPVYACLWLAGENLNPDEVVTPCVDRSRWIGRGGSVACPRGDAGHAVLDDGAVIPGLPGQPLDTGLDPVGVLRVRLHLEPGLPRRLSLVLTAASDPGTLRARVDRYRHAAHVQRGSNMSHILAGVRLHELQLDPQAWGVMLALQTLLSAQNPRAHLGAAPTGGWHCERRSLWRHGISGERPLLLVDVEEEAGLPQILQLKAMLRLGSLAGLGVDLVVVNGEAASYHSPVRQQLADILARHRMRVAEAGTAPWKGSLHVLTAEALSPQERATLEHLARVHLHADGRTLAEALAHRLQALEAGPARAGLRLGPVSAAPARRPERAGAPFEPGHFDPTTGAYRFAWDARARPPRPWMQVLANPDFGTQLSERGAGMSWAGNSRMQPLTPWFNDPLVDEASEGFWLQDLDRGQAVWLGREAADGPVQVRHEPGRSELSQTVMGLELRLRWVVDTATAVKQCRVQLRNPGRAPRRLRLVGWAEWLLGDARHQRLSVLTAAEILGPRAAGDGGPMPQAVRCLRATQLDDPAGFGAGSTAFVLWRGDEGAAGPEGEDEDWTCDRRELFDRDGRAFLPDRLGRRQGAGLDACAALARRIELPPGGVSEATWLLGHAPRADAAWDAARSAWRKPPEQREREALDAQRCESEPVQVRSPDPRFDVLVNHWLPYQTRVCRLWARAGFYQAGGALGFRDQLQDAAGLIAHAPQRLAAQIRVHAQRQFVEGDVQHWWHEPTGAGVRTHFSDDLLWLPWAIALYRARTGDEPLLDESLPFLEGSPIPPGKEDVYEVPRIASSTGSVYEHGARAIDRSLRTGPHGLPLMGTGDWNDGMNRIGHEGRGESVWLAWFLCTVVDAYLPLAQARGEAERVSRWRTARAAWAQALEHEAWDGAWYRRAFFDDGTPLGASAHAEARIDLIAQAWAVLSAAGDPVRARAAMGAARAQLHDAPHQLLRLLWPPLQHAQPHAGYIQAYPPGVRENGGQYNHGAVWALMAHARLGEAQAAWEAFEALSPAHRAADAQGCARYGLEPYVMAGDVYTAAPYVGRGGWSWYTGSSGWLLRAALEEILGVVADAEGLHIRPCLPPHWPGAALRWRHPQGGWIHIHLLADPGEADRLAGEGPATLEVPGGSVVRWEALPPGSRLKVNLRT